ncbi:Undecaprenyl diphosphate synthase [hydrothermal vent metagenome]|uniref:Undecaprenyl diphosphate synthase n=1 Tax=hydrothermal vent metagenome TaxID=652676 RepID=A0A3B0V4D2_9ZZZZ
MTIPHLDPDHIPRHIAIIMDGNGRWAQRKGLARAIGHKAGVKSVQKIVKAGRELGVQVLTLYAFSSENWQRPALEVKTLMGLLKSYLKLELNNLTKNNIQLRAIGEVERLPAEVRDVLTDTINCTAANNGMILNLALSYGSRQEITRAVKAIVGKCLAGELSDAAINEDTVNDFLYTSDLPDPDMVIRTGGESRLSNFLLWQASYAEIYITETAWPNFRRDHLISAITDYQQRQRRFGKTGEQVQKQP